MPSKTKTLRKHIHHVDKRLKFSLRLYFIISIVMLAIVSYDIFKSILSIEFALFGIIFGIGAGIISSRMNHLSWNHDGQKIVSRLDTFGIIILAFYIVFAIFRAKIIELFVQGPVVGAISFSIISGIMIGRVIGTRGAILKVLEEQGII